jgi:hypothetical protein
MQLPKDAGLLLAMVAVFCFSDVGAATLRDDLATTAKSEATGADDK